MTDGGGAIAPKISFLCNVCGIEVKGDKFVVLGHFRQLHPGLFYTAVGFALAKMKEKEDEGLR